LFQITKEFIKKESSNISTDDLLFQQVRFRMDNFNFIRVKGIKTLTNRDTSRLNLTTTIQSKNEPLLVIPNEFNLSIFYNDDSKGFIEDVGKNFNLSQIRKKIDEDLDDINFQYVFVNEQKNKFLEEDNTTIENLVVTRTIDSKLKFILNIDEKRKEKISVINYSTGESEGRIDSFEDTPLPEVRQKINDEEIFNNSKTFKFLLNKDPLTTKQEKTFTLRDCLIISEDGLCKS